jgi:hypothetical protein
VRLAAAFAAHELRTQGRSLRFRVLAALYVIAGATPAAVIWLRRDQAGAAIGGATFAAETLDVLPVLTAVFAFLISLDAITREQDEGAWSTVSLTGMSSSGYLLRRWLALQAILLPLLTLPLLAAAGAAVAMCGPGVVAAGPFLGPWLMHVVPIALAFSALAIGVGTIAGGALNAFLLGAFVLALLPALVNDLLGLFGFRVGSQDWLSMLPLFRSFRRLVNLGDWADSFPLVVSESPYDARVSGEQLLSAAAVPVALSAAALGFAVRYLRRTRPDVRPWRARPDHPLRTFLGTVARLRERYTPDPAPAGADLLALGLALLLTAGASALILDRARHYEALGHARFAAERSEGPDPTPADVVPGRWRVEGKIGADRRVDLTVTAEMRNLGSASRGHLAFALNPFLKIAEARAGEGRLTLSRSWDRLAVDLSPPIPPGGRRELRFRLAGEPARVVTAPGPYNGWSFYKQFGKHLSARFARDLLDVASSYRVPSISPRRIELSAADLSPIPRYQAWKLDEDQEVLGESYIPQADVEVALTGPGDLLLADACGGVARAGRLADRCRLPLAELCVLGGRYRLLPAPAGGTTVAVYPAHAVLGALHLGFVTEGTRRLGEAWPGASDLRRMVVMEWPADGVFDADAVGQAWIDRWRDTYDRALGLRGNLVLLSEADVTRDKLLKPDAFVAELVASRLVRRRALAADDSLFFLQLFRNIALQRLGLGPESGAAVTGIRPGQGGMLSIPPPKDYYSGLYWRSRFPALVSALRHRMGEEALRQAVDELLSRTDEQRPGTRQELFETLARHGGPDLPLFLKENFVQGGLAEPVLDRVEFRQAADGWRVTGRLHNLGNAEALCKVALTTDLGPVETLVRAAAEGDGSFELRTTHRPLAVLLDPDQECHRLVPNGAPRDRVFFQGGR